MWSELPLFPERASAIGGRVDAVYFFILGVATFFTLLIAGLILYFFVKYRRRAPEEIGANIRGNLRLEILWTALPLLIAMVMFVWGASVYFELSRPPREALDVYVVGKQWMWKVQHLNGRREINEL